MIEPESDEGELEARLTMSLLDQLVNGKPDPIVELVKARMEAAARKMLRNIWGDAQLPD